jgi:hypothetical protein
LAYKGDQLLARLAAVVMDLADALLAKHRKALTAVRYPWMMKVFPVPMGDAAFNTQLWLLLLPGLELLPKAGDRARLLRSRF